MLLRPLDNESMSAQEIYVFKVPINEKIIQFYFELNAISLGKLHIEKLNLKSCFYMAHTLRIIELHIFYIILSSQNRSLKGHSHLEKSFGSKGTSKNVFWRNLSQA